MTKTWHYELNGKRYGALSHDEVVALIKSRTIGAATLVWARGMPDWIPLSHSEMAAYLVETDVPPTVPTERISNALVWILAVAPLIGLSLEAFIAALTAPEYLADSAVDAALRTGKYWYVTAILNIALSLMDAKKLKDAGIDTKSFGNLALVVPVYLWRRAKALHQSKAYFWVWMASFGVTLLA